MKPVIAIVGPTGIGKTDFALSIAQLFNCEIVNADSRQIYSLMNIGTAKPTPCQQLLVPHHLIDIIYPDEAFSLSQYQQLANTSINTIQSLNKVPLIVGGTGLYIWALLEGWTVPHVAPDNSFRGNLEIDAKEKGAQFLFEQLKIVDPVATNKILPTNVRRIIRALEIYKATGQPASTFWGKKQPPYNILILGLTTDREKLYQRIDDRVDTMIEQGFVKEVRYLLDKGYDLNLPSMSGIGYRQIGMFLQGKIDYDNAVSQIKFSTHQFARKQYNWFRLSDSRIKWFNIYDNILDHAKYLINDFMCNN